MARGIPSRRRQISTTVGSSVPVVSEMCGATACERSMKSRVAGDSVAGLQRGHRPQLFVGRPQTLTAGRQNPHRRRHGEDRLDHLGGGIEDVLAVVEHQQSRSALQSGRHTSRHGHPLLLGDSEDGGHGFGHRSRVADRGELDHPHPVGEIGGQPSGDLQGEPRLAHPTRAGQRDQAVLAQRRFEFGQLRFATDERGGALAQVARRGIDCLQGRKLHVSPGART